MGNNDSTRLCVGKAMQSRKMEHRALCLHETARGGSVDRSIYPLEYNALTDANMRELELPCELFGKRLKYPFIISSMSGGSAECASFNACLRRCAARLQIGMAVGSMRALLEGADIETYGGRRQSDEVLLMGNIGIGQIAAGQFTHTTVANALKELGADAIYCHLNVLQEFVQVEGDHDFSNAQIGLADIVQNLGYPVIVKEVGNGIGLECAKALHKLGVNALDTAAYGGTSFVRIEGLRAREQKRRKAVYRSQMLEGLGVGLADSITACREALGSTGIVIASGGIENAVQAVQCLRLGANLVALARPIFRAWSEGGESQVMDFLEAFCESMALVHALSAPSS
ncbi:MAG: hypothetical protein WC966_01940 [Bradymonadales bacterium]|jgi:isopentenyl-diphosphate delta-isomerase